MNRINFACRRNRWPRAFVAALLVLINLTPIQAQDLTGERQPLPCRFCSRPGPARIEPQAGQWKTWALTSGSQFRLPSPPGGLAQEVEIKDLITRANRRDTAALDAIGYWDSGPPGYRWNEFAIDQLVRNSVSGPRSARILSLLNVATYDATIAAWDSKYVYNRQRPSEVNSHIAPAITVPNSPSYPSEHAAVASAAAAVLGYLFPNDAQTYERAAQEC